MNLRAAYAGKRVFVTGHTGFKGSWLTLWLSELGAEVTGYSLAPNTEPALFSVLGLSSRCRDLTADVRDFDKLRTAIREARPHVIFHLAAQPLVRESYEHPLETIQTNVMGTAHLLEAIRVEKLSCAVVIVTSDKCYENGESLHGYREDDAMGGHDIYSMSKGATELLVSSYRRSFFGSLQAESGGVRLASARAGNVIGGGDWAKDRIIPDIVRAIAKRIPVVVRNPMSVRPWQHVLEPLSGYLLLGSRLQSADSSVSAQACEGWNFGPNLDAARPVKDLVSGLIEGFGEGSWEDGRDKAAPHEANLLRLSIEKAHVHLGWRPRWDFATTLAHTVDWYKAHRAGATTESMIGLSLSQITDYGAPSHRASSSTADA